MLPRIAIVLTYLHLPNMASLGAYEAKAFNQESVPLPDSQGFLLTPGLSCALYSTGSVR